MKKENAIYIMEEENFIKFYKGELIDLGHEEAEKVFQERELEKLARQAEISEQESRKIFLKKDIYIPKFAYELRDFIGSYYRKKEKPLPKNFFKMKKKQLYAIYFNLIK